ncbi:hypothetical protein ACQJBY_018712 [Aegilops geniculata]
MAEVLAEHRIQMPAPAARAGMSTAPEKLLNRFVHLVALVERFGNALGTLAFTWATVVLLGGYPAELRRKDDFWFTITIVFLEAARMFSRNNNLDYRLFFRSRGSFKSLSWNAMILVLCFSNVLVCILIWNKYATIQIPALPLAVLAISPSLFPGAARLLICNLLCRAMSLWSPVVAVLLLGPSVPYSFDEDFNIHKLSSKNSIAKLTMYLILFVVVLLATISRLQFPGIMKLVDLTLGSRIIYWRRVILNLCMLAAVAMFVFTFEGVGWIVILIFKLCGLVVIVSFGNLQIPAAVLRIVLALLRLKAQSYYGHDEHVDKKILGDKTNLVPSLNIFYGMVLGQGILYIVACILDVFSCILLRCLARGARFRGPRAVEYVNLYYAYVFEKCMEGAVFARKKISLIAFAMDSLESDSPKMQLYGLHMLHIFLKNEPIKTKAVSKLATSTKTVTVLFNMLGWTSEGDANIRSFAAKVIAELAGSLRVVSVPGAMQLLASLLDTVHQQKIKDPLLDIGSLEAKQDTVIQQVAMDEQRPPMLKWLKQMAVYCLIPREEPSNINGQNSCTLRCWKQITKCWYIPEEEPSTDQDLLPVLGMLILDTLASFDIENCIEINRATGLISKIIDFTSNITDMNISETDQALLKGSSLRLLRRLVSTQGKFGVTLRQEISEHPFLLSNLAVILEDSGSSQELTELTAEILRNISMDANARDEIGKNRVIISRLMHAFLNREAASSTYSDKLRKVAGQALAVLAMDSANNCLVMLGEPGYVFIKELTFMIHGDMYRYVAASLLRSMCMHAQPKLGKSELKEISYILRQVLEEIMDAEGAELEILVGLSSQICNAITGDFVRELEHGQITERFINRLVCALNSNMTPTARCPGIRRMIVEHAINIMECNPSYTDCFNKCWMMEALLRVEHTPSRAEMYRFFMGDAGLMEHSVPLSALVARAKELMGREWRQGISSVTVT